MRTFTYAIFIHVLKEYNRAFEQLCEAYQLTQTEVDVLAFLANNPQFKYAKDIVCIRRLTKSQTSIAVDALCRKGYLQRATDEKNRRQHTLHITNQAKELVCRIQGIQQDFEKKMYTGFSDEEKKQFLAFLERVDASMNEEGK